MLKFARKPTALYVAHYLTFFALSACSSAAEGSKPSAKEAVTFNKHIAPLVFERCAGCHRPGEVAPFSLLTYADVSKRAEHIRNVTSEGIMPPWRPVTGHGDFSNGRRLTPAEIGLIRQWVAEGHVEGNPADLPAAPKFATGWQLGTPDAVVTLPEPVEVPASGRDPYQNFVLPFTVPTGKYLKAVEFRPSNRRVVHHAVLFIDTSGKSRQLDAADPGQGFLAITPPGRHLAGTLAIWTPGRNPLPLPEGLSMPWPENADLVLNLHLHPSGKPELEQSSIGFYFTDEPPKRSLLDVTLIDTKIDIPPGEKAFHTQDSVELPIDMEALSIFPHMHMIGKDIKITATLPDGTVESLLWINDWNFNWQDLYQYAEPVRLPKGTKLLLECVHDNSAENPFNPRNPPERVRWGEQTFNEMSIAFLNFMPVQESDMSVLQQQSKGLRGVKASIVPASTKVALADAPAAQPKPVTEEDFARIASEGLRRADKNNDGKLSFEEVAAAVAGREPRAELDKKLMQFDADGDMHLNLSEVTAAIKALSKRK